MSAKQEREIANLIAALNLPFIGTTILSSSGKKFEISPFNKISISGIGPVLYRDKKSKKIYTILQRRFKDNFQWWFPGGYIELPHSSAKDLLSTIDRQKAFRKIKNATIDELYKNAALQNWQKAKLDINDPKKLTQSFKKHKINWPKNIDANWQEGWQREVLEETGINLDNFANKIILDFKFNKTFMIGAERDRLTNIDGKFCAFLEDLTKAPKTAPDNETEELKWIALEDIYFDKKRKNYYAKEKNKEDKIVNLYTVSLIEEALHEIICYKIKKISQIKNPYSKCKTSFFNTPQNLQNYILQNLKPNELSKSQDLQRFASWKFGELEIAQNLCGKNSDWFYDYSTNLCKKICQNFIKIKKS